MRKALKVIGIILGIIIILGLIFFVVDYNRVKNNERPIFCISNPAGTISDGGTVEFFGLGYKVIDFHTLAGFDDIKIGTWFMDYNDFEEEMKAYEKIFEENLVSSGELNRNPENVTIEVDESTVSAESVSITIYGKLSNGIYRIVKPVYDNGYIDIYSNEFEIK